MKPFSLETRIPPGEEGAKERMEVDDDDYPSWLPAPPVGLLPWAGAFDGRPTSTWVGCDTDSSPGDSILSQDSGRSSPELIELRPDSPPPVASPSRPVIGLWTGRLEPEEGLYCAELLPPEPDEEGLECTERLSPVKQATRAVEPEPPRLVKQVTLAAEPVKPPRIAPVPRRPAILRARKGPSALGLCPKSAPRPLRLAPGPAPIRVPGGGELRVSRMPPPKPGRLTIQVVPHVPFAPEVARRVAFRFQ
jgi:hypothetical protein